MKPIFLALLFLLTQNVFAAFNEVECHSTQGNKKITFEIEQPFPNNSVFRNATLTVDENGAQTTQDYNLTLRSSRNSRRLTYWGNGVTLDIDLFPDQRPTWGRNYRSTLSGSELTNSFQSLNCNFPNIF